MSDTKNTIKKIRQDFPCLVNRVYGKELIYFDNASSTQKPQSVLQAMTDFYAHYYANVHRGVHFLSEKATEAFEHVRDQVQTFMGAEHREEIIFVKGTTEAINLVAQSFVRPRVKTGDEIIISTMEHHANIVPWQQVCEQTGAVLKIIPMTDQGELFIENYKTLFSDKTKFVSIIHASNVLGTINPVKTMIQIAHEKGVPVMIDGAQAIVHEAVDVKVLDCDFYTFSSHKLYGPTGVGILYGKYAWLEEMIPYQSGGDMIQQVSFEKTTYRAPPYKFEAGTPNIAGVIGLGAALDYLNTLDKSQLYLYEKNLLDYLTLKLSDISDIRLVGTAKAKVPIVSFVFNKVHAHDVGTVLNQQGVAVRVGHHCAMPLMQRLKLSATARVSLAFYNTEEEIDYFIESLALIKHLFSK